MKQVTAYISPDLLDKVLSSLDELPVRGMSITEVRGFGRGRAELLRENPSYQARQFGKKLKLEIVCPDDQAERIARTIQQAAYRGDRATERSSSGRSNAPSALSPVRKMTPPSPEPCRSAPS